MDIRKSNVESIDYPDCRNAVSLILVPFGPGSITAATLNY